MVTGQVVTLPAAGKVLTAVCGERVTRRQVRQLVRLLEPNVLRPAHRSTGHGDSTLLDAVELAVLAVFLVVAKEVRAQRTQGREIVRRSMTDLLGTVRLVDVIRAAFLTKRARFVVRIENQSIDVVPERYVNEDTAYWLPLWEVRESVQAALAQHREQQPWEWIGRRRVEPSAFIEATH